MLPITLCYAQNRIRSVTLENHLNSVIPDSFRAFIRWPKSLRALSTRLTRHNVVSAYPTYHRLSYLISTWSCFELKSLSLVVFKNKNSAAVFCVFPTLFSRHNSRHNSPLTATLSFLLVTISVFRPLWMNELHGSSALKKWSSRLRDNLSNCPICAP